MKTQGQRQARRPLAKRSYRQYEASVRAYPRLEQSQTEDIQQFLRNIENYMGSAPLNDIRAFKQTRAQEETENYSIELSQQDPWYASVSPSRSCAQDAHSEQGRDQSEPTISYYNLSFLNPLNFSPLLTLKDTEATHSEFL